MSYSATGSTAGRQGTPKLSPALSVIRIATCLLDAVKNNKLKSRDPSPSPDLPTPHLLMPPPKPSIRPQGSVSLR
jgi:hypothetical protein